MELIRDIHNVRSYHHGCVLSIGNFDGVHRGHQALLKNLQREGQRLNLPTMVMVFEPQPLEFFLAERAPARLTGLREKVKYLAQSGIDYLLCAEFNATFAAMSPEQFVEQLLVDKLGVKFLTVGDDFRFGKERKGDLAFLQAAGKQVGFEVMNTDSFFFDDGQRISSTMVRDAVQSGDFILAQTLLGHPYCISGRVIKGKQLGRTIGFPTANLLLKRLVSPVHGVYAVEVEGVTDRPLPGVANIGTRPTVSGQGLQLEVHLFDTRLDLYGHHIDVILRKKLRNEQRFASIDELKAQIAKDVMAAKAFLSLSSIVSSAETNV